MKEGMVPEDVPIWEEYFGLCDGGRIRIGGKGEGKVVEREIWRSFGECGDKVMKMLDSFEEHEI